MGKIWCFHWLGPVSTPGQGTKILHFFFFQIGKSSNILFPLTPLLRKQWKALPK